MTKTLKYFLTLALFAIITQDATSGQKTKSNDSIILASVKTGNISNLNQFLNNPKAINRKYGERERTLLTYAIESGQLVSARYLIENGADLEIQYDRKTPLMFSARYGRTRRLCGSSGNNEFDSG